MTSYAGIYKYLSSVLTGLQFLDHATVVNLNRTKRFLFDLKCTKIAGGWGSAPDPAGGAYSAPPAVRRFWRGGKGGGKGREGKGGEGEEERGRRGEGKMCPPL